MSTTSLPSRKPASSDAKLAADLRAQKSCRKFSLEWLALGEQLLSPLPATATIAVSAAAQRAGLHMQEGKADLHYGQARAGQGRAAGFRASSSTGRQAEQRGWKCNKRKRNMALPRPAYLWGFCLSHSRQFNCSWF